MSYYCPITAVRVSRKIQRLTERDVHMFKPFTATKTDLKTVSLLTNSSTRQSLMMSEPGTGYLIYCSFTLNEEPLLSCAVFLDTLTPWRWRSLWIMSIYVQLRFALQWVRVQKYWYFNIMIRDNSSEKCKSVSPFLNVHVSYLCTTFSQIICKNGHLALVACPHRFVQVYKMFVFLSVFYCNVILVCSIFMPLLLVCLFFPPPIFITTIAVWFKSDTESTKKSPCILTALPPKHHILAHVEKQEPFPFCISFTSFYF